MQVIIAPKEVPEREAGDDVRAGEHGRAVGLEDAEVLDVSGAEPGEGPFVDGDARAVKACVESVEDVGAALVVGNPAGDEEKDNDENEKHGGSGEGEAAEELSPALGEGEGGFGGGWGRGFGHGMYDTQEGNGWGLVSCRLEFVEDRSYDLRKGLDNAADQNKVDNQERL